MQLSFHIQWSVSHTPGLKETQKQNSAHRGVWILPGAIGISFVSQLFIPFNQSHGVQPSHCQVCWYRACELPIYGHSGSSLHRQTQA